MVEENLTLKLPKDFKWLSVKIVDSTKGSKATATIASDNEVVFNLGLFRKNEFLRFEALVDIPQKTEENISATNILNSELKFEHRIADTSKVEIRPMNLELPNLKKRLFSRITIPATILIYIIFIVYLFGGKEVPGMFYYNLKEGDSVTTVKATPRVDNTVELETVDGSEYKTISLKEFSENSQAREIREISSDTWLGKVLGGNYMIWIMTVMLGLMFVFMSTTLIVVPYMEYKKVKKLRQSLNLDQK